MDPKPTLLLKNAKQVVTCVPRGSDLAGVMENCSILVHGDKIIDIGDFNSFEEKYDLRTTKTVDCAHKILAPGFVDSHTHVVFGGSRVKEYALKMTRTPAEVRRIGVPVGITASMEMTRAASEDVLLASARERLQSMLAHGTTTVESKSGYGLNLETELKMLRVNQTLQKDDPDQMLPEVVSTFLGAHAFPPGADQESYVREIIDIMIPQIAAENLAVFCDVYIDEGYFNLRQTREILSAAREAGMLLKIHADQYSALGGAELAAELTVTSADHLNYTSKNTMRALAEAGVVGVLMPLIDFAVKHPQPFDARAMIDAGMQIALATDICPGGWTESMQLVMQFACRVHGLSPEEAIRAVTSGGAQALALTDRGTLAPGMLADIQRWDLSTYEEVIYRLGHNAVDALVHRGNFVEF